MIIPLFICISWLISICYVICIFRLYLSWSKLEGVEETKPTLSKISIVIALRNEEKNLSQLLNSIALQDYNKEDFEILFVDDHSEDNSVSIIQGFQRKHPELNVHLHSLAAGKEGKKNALRVAYKWAKYDIIACTDGDCILPPSWLSIISRAFGNAEKILFSGGVCLTNEKSFLDDFQSLELLSLIASGAASIGLNKPIMCNGANMAFRKTLLNSVQTDRLHTNLASGDDVFLLMECKRIYGPDSIGFIKHQEHWVKTFTEPNLLGYLHQRIRWVSKSSSYTDLHQITLSILILLQNLIIVSLILAAFVNLAILQTWVLIFILKGLTDFFFLRNISSFLSKKQSLKWYPLISLAYPFFIVFVALAGQVSGFKWKGRSYQK